MIFRFLDTTHARAFAATIVTDYDRLRRSAAMRGDSAEKWRLKREKLVQRFDQYCREHKPNFYKKAKMIQVIQNGLEEKGIAAGDIGVFLNDAMVKRLKQPR
ncbi:MAG: hypothetical protein ACREPN_00625 [Rudaea sp.]